MSQTDSSHSKPKKLKSREIREPVQRLLWARAAGRCQFAGCNEPLWKSSVTQETVNKAQKAHIYSFSGDGPRGNDGVEDDRLNEAENLMLVCHQCHRKIDKEPDGGRYSADLLKKWKNDHERRIEIVTGIRPDRRSHVLLYGAGIGDHLSPLSFSPTADAMFPDRYPAEALPVEIPTINSWQTDRDEAFWRTEDEHLNQMFNRRVRERIAAGEVAHLSVFALAPQPLLIRLGALLTDIPEVDVYQRHREPQTWKWQEASTEAGYTLEAPADTSNPPVLVLSLSANISRDRITSAIGGEVSLWKIAIPGPNNDFLQSREQLSEFRIIARQALSRIKDAHGTGDVLNVFPAMPASLAVELGRVIQPKADLPLRIFDQVKACGGFIPTLTVNQAHGGAR